MKPSRNGLRMSSKLKTLAKTKKASQNQNQNKNPRSLGDKKSPSVAVVAVSNRQEFKVGRTDRYRFHNSELISSVSAPSVFSDFDLVLTLPVNPGMKETFPWLSEQARQWEFYRFHKLRFRYITRAPTTTTGSVIISPEYSVKDPPPQTEAEATNTADAVEDSAWKEITCELTPSSMFPLGGRKLIRTSAIAADLNLYDAAVVYIVTAGIVGPLTVGKLWVDYDVEFFAPQNSPSQENLAVQTAYLQNPTATNLPANSFVDMPVAAIQNAINLKVLANDFDFTLPKGVYRILAVVNINTPVASTSISWIMQLRFGATVIQSGLERGSGNSITRWSNIAIDSVHASDGTTPYSIRITNNDTISLPTGLVPVANLSVVIACA